MRLNILIMAGLILFAGCVGWWAGSNAPLISSTIRPVDIPEPYYTAQQNDSLELNDLDVSLRDLKMPHKYEKNVFDCSEKAAYVEWFLSNRGFNVSIYEGDLYDKYRHSWVVVTVNCTPIMIEADENATSLFVRGDGFVVIFVGGVIRSYTLIQVPVFQSHRSCTMIFMRRLKTMDANMIGGL